MNSSPLDLLHIPGIGALLRSRWGRLWLQIPLFLLLLLIIYDGFTGPQFAPENTATVLAWVHYRGLVILILLAAGNFFCMGCPFTLLRTIARRLSLKGGRWPSWLRNKWVSVISLFTIFWLYEWLDLWASPLLTAWVAIGYVVLSFTLEAWFSESPFCKYVCPLGVFNFTFSMLSPLQITERSQEVCRDCEGKECVNGSAQVLGCGTELFVPMMESNMDCVFCLDCARACPYDNVALQVRNRLKESQHRLNPPSFALAFMIMSLVFSGLMNAFGMVPPVYKLQSWLADSLGLRSDATRLLLIFGIGNLLLPLAAIAAMAAFRRVRTGSLIKSLRAEAIRFVPAVVPLGAGIWLAHYGFHLAIGGLAIVPVVQAFMLDHGIEILGSSPRWDLSMLIPQNLIFPLQVAAIFAGLLGSFASLVMPTLKSELPPIESLRRILPWAVLLVLMTIAALSVFSLPMEMRGTLQIGNP
jgi:polyferredoxin